MTALELVQKYMEIYPNTMVIDKMDEFERIKLAGKIDLLLEMIAEFEDED